MKQRIRFLRNFPAIEAFTQYVENSDTHFPFLIGNTRIGGNSFHSIRVIDGIFPPIQAVRRLILWKIKGDLHRSIYDFEEFLKHIKHAEFVKEKELAIKWISEIKRQIVEPIGAH